MQNKAVFYFHFDIFIFENKVDGGEIAITWAICPVPGCCGMPCLCRAFGLLVPKHYLALQSFDLEHTWWRLLQKNVFCTQNERFTFFNPTNDSDTKNNLFCFNYLKNVFRVINMPFSAIWWWMISLKRWQIHADFKQFIIFSYSVTHRKYIHLLRVCFPFNWEIPH